MTGFWRDGRRASKRKQGRGTLRWWVRVRARVAEAYEAFRIIAAFVAFSALLGLSQNDGFPLGESDGSQRHSTRPTPMAVQSADQPHARLCETPQTWLVDGFNVLNVALLRGEERDDFWGPDARGRLLELVRGFPDAANVVVVFDGGRPAPREDPAVAATGDAHFVFAPDADEWLLRALRESAEPGLVAVVTADRRLAARARSRGAQIVSPSQFVAQCRREAPVDMQREGGALADRAGDDGAG